MQTGVGSKTTLILVSLLMCGRGYSQTISGSIAGTVVDVQHAALPNAAVSARDVQQSFTFNTRTDETGRVGF